MTDRTFTAPDTNWVINTPSNTVELQFKSENNQIIIGRFHVENDKPDIEVFAKMINKIWNSVT